MFAHLPFYWNGSSTPQGCTCHSLSYTPRWGDLWTSYTLELTVIVISTYLHNIQGLIQDSSGTSFVGLHCTFSIISMCLASLGDQKTNVTLLVYSNWSLYWFLCRVRNISLSRCLNDLCMRPITKLFLRSCGAHNLGLGQIWLSDFFLDTQN